MKRHEEHLPEAERQQYKSDIISKTKKVLMDKFNITEPEAHKYIQKCAMDSGTDIAETCEMLILLHGSGN